MSLLIISRHEGEAVQIGSDVTVRVKKLRGRRVQLEFVAPENVKILRGELEDRDEPRKDAA